jgi:hypothetical protein
VHLSCILPYLHLSHRVSRSLEHTRGRNGGHTLACRGSSFGQMEIRVREEKGEQMLRNLLIAEAAPLVMAAFALYPHFGLHIHLTVHMATNKVVRLDRTEEPVL